MSEDNEHLEKQMRRAMAETLKAGRKAMGMTQAQLAAVVKVKRDTVAAWENERYKPNVARIHAALPDLANEIRRAGMKYKKKSCGSCMYSLTVRGDFSKYCNYMEMTGKSRIAQGFASTEPGRPCGAWEPRDKKEHERVTRARVKLSFREGYDANGMPPTREVAELERYGGKKDE